MVAPLSRRLLLRALALAPVGPTLWLPGTASAATRTNVRVEIGERGVTVELGLAHGPFPAPGAKYSDNTCLVFVPHSYRQQPDQRIDTLVHFHGHHAKVREAMTRMRLREQLADSQQNAILVAPQGPLDAKDSSGGKLEMAGGFEAFLGEVRRAIQRTEVATALGPAALGGAARIGATAISAHSGGYQVTAACLREGGYNVDEVYLFDALYGARTDFRRWVVERKDAARGQRHKLLSFYTDGGDVQQQCDKLASELAVDGIAVHSETNDRAPDRVKLTRTRAGFVATTAPHNKVVHQNHALRDCLRWSCFRRVVA